MTVAYQRIEDEVSNLIESIAHIEPEALNVFLSRIWQIAPRVQILQDLSKLYDDDAEHSRIKNFCKRVEKVRQERNGFIHSANHSFNKQTGEIHQVNKKTGKLKLIGGRDFERLINRMYLILHALDQRHYGVVEWDSPLRYWESPPKFWEELV